MQLGIRIKLLLWLVLVILPIGAASSFAVKVIGTRLSERIEADLANTRRLEAARLNEVLDAYQRDALSLAEGEHVVRFLSDVDAARAGLLPVDTVIGGIDGFEVVDIASAWPLQQLAEGMQRRAALLGSEIVEVQLVDRQGRILGSTADFGWVPRDPGQVARVLRSGELEFGNAFRTAEGNERLGMSVPVLDAEHAVVGAVQLETRLGPVVNLVGKHEGVGATSEAHIAQPMPNGDAEFITPLRFERDAAFSRVVPIGKATPINRALLAPRGNVVRAKDYRGEESVLAYETLPTTGWGLVVKIDAAEAFAPVSEIRRVISLAGLATVTVVVLGWMLFLHPIASRLQRAARGAERVANGEYLMPLDDRRVDEIGEMSRSIDSLAAELDADIRMRANAEEQLRHQAMHDELTGLFNRKHANEVIRRLDAEDNSANAAIMFLDLDGFKRINDRYGHAAGDEVLSTVARRLSAAVQFDATLARWGGDEFVVILPDSTVEQSAGLSERIRVLFAEPIMTSFGRHLVGCSIGLARAGTDQSLEHVLAEADERMYTEKQKRRPGAVLPSTVANAVELALEEDRLDVWYQPIVETRGRAGNRLAGAEALVRLRTRHGGIVTPGEFLGEIRDRTISRDLDRCVMHKALDAVARWRRCGMVDNGFRISVNLTGQSLADPELVGDIRDNLARLELPASVLTLELSEEAHAIDESIVLQLRTLGVRIAIDDIGMQHSNLDRLVRLCPDMVKIDRSWLSDPSGNPDGDLFGHNNHHTRIVLPKLIDICRQMGLAITAEGVETMTQFDMLQELDVSMIQGFLFDAPQPGARFISRWGLLGMDAELDHSLRLPLAS